MVCKSGVDHIICKKCKKKCDGDSTKDTVYCKGCDGEMMKKRCKAMRVAKVDFEEEKTEKLWHLSIFSSVMDKLLTVDSASIPQADLRQMLLRLPSLKITVSNMIIQSAEKLHTEL